MATRRERKVLEAERAHQDAQSRAKAQILKAVGIAMGVSLAVSATIYHVWLKPVTPVDAMSKALDRANDKSPARSLDEMQKDILAKDQVFKKSKEWVWGEEGRTELLIQAYRKETGHATAAREQRARLLSVIGRTAKPRAQWPKLFNDTKAQELMQFLAEILRAPTGPGPEAVSAMDNLAAFVAVNREFSAFAEREILARYAMDARPGPRGAAMLALASFESPEGVKLASREVNATDRQVMSSAIYTLGKYLDNPSLGKEAARSLRKAVESRPDSRPLALKLLANHGNREIASLVPQTLRKGASVQDVEAGAFAAARLGLKQLKPLLMERLNDSPSAFLSQEIDRAIQELDRK